MAITHELDTVADNWEGKEQGWEVEDVEEKLGALLDIRLYIHFWLFCIFFNC